MPSTERFTYETISQIHQKVRKAANLIKLEPPDFYLKLTEYVNALRKNYETAYETDPTSPNTMLLGDEFRKVSRLTKDIYDRRERKIVLLALANARGGSPDTKFLTKSERELFDDIINILKKRRSQGLKIEKSAPLSTSGYMLVRILDDVGTFVATNLKTYTLLREDVVSLPVKTGSVLSDKGKVERLLMG